MQDIEHNTREFMYIAQKYEFFTTILSTNLLITQTPFPMKTLIATLLLLFLSPSLWAQQASDSPEFPYAKVMKMSPDEFKKNKFKYDEYRNQYVLRKTNGLQGTSNVLSALSGTTADIRPNVNDYVVVVQYGNEGVANVTVTFYKPATYHEILTFGNDNGENLLRTNSTNFEEVQYNYAGYNFVLTQKRVGVSSLTTATSLSDAKSLDESYDIYTYTILTGHDANSAYLDKERAKQDKRDAKGKKQRDVNSFM